MKKIFFVLSLSTSLLLSNVIDPINEYGWKKSEQNNLMNKCMGTANTDEEWIKVLPSTFTRANFCECMTEEFMKNITYRDFLIKSRLVWRQISKEARKYDGLIYKTNEDREVENKIKNLEKITLQKCGNSDVVNKGILEHYDDLQEKLDERALENENQNIEE